MILFILGVIVGLLVALLVSVSTLAFSNSQVVNKIKNPIMRNVNNIKYGKGYIAEPTSEADEARNEIIEHNRAAGRDTRIDELL